MTSQSASRPTLDLVGVGIGPFNLGLAALLDPIAGLRAEFLDRKPRFDWHPGLMLDGAELQVPFLADLVTLADPTSRWSFLNYLREHDRLYRFYFYEHLHVLRREFQAYCAWVAGELGQTRFGEEVREVERRPDGSWQVTSIGADGRQTVREARHVVLGVGTAPWVPTCAREHLNIGERAATHPAKPGDAPVLHSADYLSQRSTLLRAATVTVIGSGQSAAEVVLDLLDHGDPGQQIDWYSRSPGFLAMEYSKLGLETFSPEYTAYFRELPVARRDARRGGQNLLYKGISLATSEAIYDALYRRSVDCDPAVDYRAGVELVGISPASGRLQLSLRHLDEGSAFRRPTDALVLATGYAPAELPLSAELRSQLAVDAAGRLDVTHDYRLILADGTPTTAFVQNAELHTHGVGTPDLGLGTHRNAVIINALLGHDRYPVCARNVFQRFGAPAQPDPHDRPQGGQRPHGLRRIA
ncbi:MAG: SidA/IucD/PvdA family monooxygenase [Patulibacter sp.]